MKKNVAASVRARLLDLARTRGEDFQLVLTRYVNERFLYRLARSGHASRFVLKGATLFTLWRGNPHRATRDLDLLGFGDSSIDSVRDFLTQVVATSVQPDGVAFDAQSLVVGPIREDQEYGGVRGTLVARLGSARVKAQIDVGFGDAITPDAEVAALPVLLDLPAPHLRVYPRETVVAEKVEAMCKLGLANTRMKDFYDLFVLSRMSSFDDELVARAIAATFERRGTELPREAPIALTAAFHGDDAKRQQWRAFLRKSNADDLGDPPAVIAEVREFVLPALLAAGSARA